MALHVYVAAHICCCAASGSVKQRPSRKHRRCCLSCSSHRGTSLFLSRGCRSLHRHRSSRRTECCPPRPSVLRPGVRCSSSRTGRTFRTSHPPDTRNRGMTQVGLSHSRPLKDFQGRLFRKCGPDELKGRLDKVLYLFGARSEVGFSRSKTVCKGSRCLRRCSVS